MKQHSHQLEDETREVIKHLDLTEQGYCCACEVDVSHFNVTISSILEEVERDVIGPKLTYNGQIDYNTAPQHKALQVIRERYIK
jgi:ATP-dependent phosphoenolpyruvate carboxykinase